MVVDCSVTNCIPVELFLGFVAIGIGLSIFGFIRQPQIPAMLAFGGIFILFMSVMFGGIIMGKIPITSIESGSTVTYAFMDNVFDFRGLPQVIFSLVGVIMMLSGGLMVAKT